MKRNLFLLIFVALITIIAFAIALPTFEINLNGQVYKIRGLDPKDFGQTFITEYFNFQPAIDLQGGSLITLNVDLTSVEADKRDEELNSIKSALYWRLWNAKISDFQLNALLDKNGANNKIIIKAPEAIDEKLMNLLLTPANFSVWVQDPSASAAVTPTPSEQDVFKQIFGNRLQVDISNEDVASAQVVSDSRCYFNEPTQPKNYCLKITFTPNGTAKLGAALGAVTQATLSPIIALDYSPVGIQAGGQIYNPSYLGNELIIYPLTDDKSLVNSILAAMIGSTPLSSNVKLDKIETLSPTMGDNTLTWLKTSLFLGVLAAIALIAYYFKERGRLFSLTFAIFVLWSIAIMKMANVVLSFSLLSGFVTSMLLFVAILIAAEYKIRGAYKGKLSGEEMKNIYKQISIKFRNITITTIVLSFVMGYYGTQISINFMIGVGCGVVVGLLSIILAFKALMPILLLNKKHD